jgi:hydrogenase/urease accessory protein HupE
MNDQNRVYMAYGSVGLGALNLCAWFIPLIGCPLSIVGLVLGILGIKSPQRVLAIVGIVLCSLGLLASLVNAAWGAWIRYNAVTSGY